MSRRLSALAAALALALHVVTLDAASGQPDRPRLAIVVQDYVGAAPEILEFAKSHVTLIYRAAGVDVEWVELDDPRLEEPEFVKGVVTVALYTDEMAERADASEDVVGKALPGGRNAKILYQRLERVWTGRFSEAAFLLGNVIAHEVGHLMLPSATHARTGLMAPELTLSIATQRLLFFTPAESRLIRDTLATAADN